MPVKDLQRNILAGIFHDRNAVDSLVTRGKSLSQVLTDDTVPGDELLGHFGLHPYSEASPAAGAISTLLSKPKSFRDELALVLRKFWQSTFQRDWAALEPGLRAESFRMRDIREERSVEDLGRELNLPVAFNDEAREIRPRAGSPISYGLIDRCYVIPSAFNARRCAAIQRSCLGAPRPTHTMSGSAAFTIRSTSLSSSRVNARNGGE